MMNIGVITLFPEMFSALDYGITGRAIKKKRLALHFWNPRDWSTQPHRKVDDRPYGGGPGMVMMYEPLHAAILHAKRQFGQCKTVFLSPQGRQVHQQQLNEVVADNKPVLFVAGRYEGLDERIIQSDIDEEWSVGDYVLSGGELAAMICIDAMARLLPGALGSTASAWNDSFMEGLLDCPHYTRPAHIDGLSVPQELLQGDHQVIARFRRKQALGHTWLKRPDLLMKKVLTQDDKQLLNEFKHEIEE